MMLYALLVVTGHVPQPLVSPLMRSRVDNPIEWGLSVPTDDLDLTDIADRKRLDRRIAAAASRVCRNQVEATNLLDQAQCTTNAIEGVRERREDLIARASQSKSTN